MKCISPNTSPRVATSPPSFPSSITMYALSFARHRAARLTSARCVIAVRSPSHPSTCGRQRVPLAAPSPSLLLPPVPSPHALPPPAAQHPYRPLSGSKVEVQPVMAQHIKCGPGRAEAQGAKELAERLLLGIGRGRTSVIEAGRLASAALRAGARDPLLQSMARLDTGAHAERALHRLGLADGSNILYNLISIDLSPMVPRYKACATTALAGASAVALRLRDAEARPWPRRWQGHGCAALGAARLLKIPAPHELAARSIASVSIYTPRRGFHTRSSPTWPRQRRTCWSAYLAVPSHCETSGTGWCHPNARRSGCAARRLRPNVRRSRLEQRRSRLQPTLVALVPATLSIASGVRRTQSLKAPRPSFACRLASTETVPGALLARRCSS